MNPSEADIRQTIAYVKQKLANSLIDKPINKPQREGYREVLDILVEDRRTYEGIQALSTQQGRGIALLGVDYLNGQCEQKVLIGVPLKQ